MKAYNKNIEANFSRASKTYDSFARMQKQAADLLLENVEQTLAMLPDGAVLELGCGTGQMSQRLAQVVSSRKLFFSDISPGMVEMCQQKLSEITPLPNDIHFQVLDAELLSDKDTYAAVLSGLTVQWFNDFHCTLQRIYKALLPGGEFIFSCLVHGSFTEWFSVCNETKVPCTANALPKSKQKIDEVGSIFDAVEYSSGTIEIDYPSAAYFFRSLKMTGTNAQVDGVKLTASQMRRLIKFWDKSLKGNTLKITYVVDIIHAKKKP